MDREEIRSSCWNEALHAFGTAYIFQRRAERLFRRQRWLTLLGILVPALVGGIALGWGTEGPVFTVILVFASGLLLIQLALSVLALVYRWDDRYAYAVQSQDANDRLASRFEALGRHPPESEVDLNLAYRLLETEKDLRRQTDNQQHITDDEKRMGMRAGLRHFQRRCVGCEQVPASLEPTDCTICGNFKPPRL